MKKLIFILLCFSLLTFGSSAKIIEVAPAGAWGLLGICGGGGGGAPAACDTTVLSATSESSEENITVAGEYYVGNGYTVGASNETICEVTIKVWHQGNIDAQTLYVEIFSLNGDNLVLEPVVAEATLAASTITTSGAEYVFEIDPPIELTAETIYAFTMSLHYIDSSNYLRTYFGANSLGNAYIGRWAVDGIRATAHSAEFWMEIKRQ